MSKKLLRQIRGKCESRYVRVDVLVASVMEQVARLLSDPTRILDEARRLKQGEGHQAEQVGELHSQIEEVEKQQARLARLYLAGSMPEEVLEAEGGRLRERRIWLETELRALKVTAPEAIEVDQLRDVLPAVAERLRVWVANSSEADFELIAQALDLQVWASHEAVRIEGSVPVADDQAQNLVTIVLTSGWLHGRNHVAVSLFLVVYQARDGQGAGRGHQLRRRGCSQPHHLQPELITARPMNSALFAPSPTTRASSWLRGKAG